MPSGDGRLTAGCRWSAGAGASQRHGCGARLTLAAAEPSSITIGASEWSFAGLVLTSGCSLSSLSLSLSSSSSSSSSFSSSASFSFSSSSTSWSISMSWFRITAHSGEAAALRALACFAFLCCCCCCGFSAAHFWLTSAASAAVASSMYWLRGTGDPASPTNTIRCRCIAVSLRSARIFLLPRGRGAPSPSAGVPPVASRSSVASGRSAVHCHVLLCSAHQMSRVCVPWSPTSTLARPASPRTADRSDQTEEAHNTRRAGWVQRKTCGTSRCR